MSAQYTIRGLAWAGSLLIIALATGLVYYPVWEFGFLGGDDQRHVANNPYVQALSWTNLTWMLAI